MNEFSPPHFGLSFNHLNLFDDVSSYTGRDLKISPSSSIQPQRVPVSASHTQILPPTERPRDHRVVNVEYGLTSGGDPLFVEYDSEGNVGLVYKEDNRPSSKTVSTFSDCLGGKFSVSVKPCGTREIIGRDVSGHLRVWGMIPINAPCVCKGEDRYGDPMYCVLVKRRKVVI